MTLGRREKIHFCHQILFEHIFCNLEHLVWCPRNYPPCYLNFYHKEYLYMQIIYSSFSIANKQSYFNDDSIYTFAYSILISHSIVWLITNRYLTKGHLPLCIDHSNIPTFKIAMQFVLNLKELGNWILQTLWTFRQRFFFKVCKSRFLICILQC